MWFKPKPLPENDGSNIWTLKYNELFEIQRCKKQSDPLSFISNLASSPRAIGTTTYLDYPFRIVIRGRRKIIIAVAMTIEEIEKDWNWIDQEIMTNLKKNNANDSLKEIKEFLIVKFDSLARVQQIELQEKRSDEYNKLFELENEPLASQYKCILHKNRKGTMYLSENYLCFYIQHDDTKLQNEKLIINLRDIRLVKKKSWLGQSAISVYTLEGEYYFSSFDDVQYRDECFVLLEQLVQRSAKKVLKSVDHSSVDLSSPSSNAPAQKAEKIINKNSIGLTDIFIKFNKSLRLPTDEIYLRVIVCKTWEGSSLKFGQIFISKHFLCFQSNKGKDIRASLPFREIQQIIKEDNMIGEKGRVISVKGKKRNYLYMFESRAIRNNTFDFLVDKWNRNFSEFDLLSANSTSSSTLLFQRKPAGISALLDNQKDFSFNYMERQPKIELEWQKYFKKHGSGFGMVEDRQHLKSLLINFGIPEKYRSSIWKLFSGANNKFHASSTVNYYESLLINNKDKMTLAIEEIDKDVPRSFPEHPYFQSEEGLESLRRVLYAYSWRNPAIGYCQSMNIIAALLLVYYPEDSAFWVLSSICEDIVPENYDKNMIGSIVDQQTFEDILSKYLPNIYSHLKEVQIPLAVFTQGWFICLFIGYLPLEIALRVLDLFFFLRGKILFAIGLAIFKTFEQPILNCNDPDELMILLKDLSPLIHDPDLPLSLFKRASEYEETLSEEKIRELQSINKFGAVKAVEKTSKNLLIRTIIDTKNTKFESHELHRLYEFYYAETSSPLIHFSLFVKIMQNLFPWMKWREDLMQLIFLRILKDNNIPNIPNNNITPNNVPNTNNNTNNVINHDDCNNNIQEKKSNLLIDLGDLIVNHTNESNENTNNKNNNDNNDNNINNNVDNFAINENITIDFLTFANGVYIITRGSLKEKLEYYFSLFDLDNDGKLDKGDYYLVLDAIARSYKDDAIEKTDLNTLVKWTFEQADIDQDGKISLEEVFQYLIISENNNNQGGQVGLLEHYLQL